MMPSAITQHIGPGVPPANAPTSAALAMPEPCWNAPTSACPLRGKGKRADDQVGADHLADRIVGPAESNSGPFGKRAGPGPQRVAA